MFYRATRHIVVIPQGTEQAISYEPGDVIPDFAQWDELVRRAHINQGSVYMDMPGIQEVAAAIAKAQDAAHSGAQAEPDAEPKAKRGRPRKAAAQAPEQVEPFDGAEPVEPAVSEPL